MKKTFVYNNASFNSNNVLRMDRLFENINFALVRSARANVDPITFMTSANYMTETEAMNLISLDFFMFRVPRHN